MIGGKTKKISLKVASLLLAFLAVLPADAYALDFTPDASRVISDPTYLPLKGQVYGVTEYEYDNLKDDGYNYLGVQTNTLSRETQRVDQALSYGVTDDFTIHVAGSYVSEAKKDYTPGTDYSFQGSEDPTFGATWRILDQKTYPVNVDINGYYSPDWVNNRYSTATSSGTVGRGGDEAGLDLAMGYKTRSFTIEGLGGATRYGNATYDNPADVPSEGSTASYWGYYGGVSTQTRLSQLFSFDLGYRYDAFNNQNGVGPLGVALTNNFGNENNFDAALNYNLIPNRLVAGVTYNYITYGKNSILYSDPTLDTSTKNDKENLFGVRLQYAFF